MRKLPFFLASVENFLKYHLSYANTHLKTYTSVNVQPDTYEQ